MKTDERQDNRQQESQSQPSGDSASSSSASLGLSSIEAEVERRAKALRDVPDACANDDGSAESSSSSSFGTYTLHWRDGCAQYEHLRNADGVGMSRISRQERFTLLEEVRERHKTRGG